MMAAGMRSAKSTNLNKAMSVYTRDDWRIFSGALTKVGSMVGCDFSRQSEKFNQKLFQN